MAALLTMLSQFMTLLCGTVTVLNFNISVALKKTNKKKT